MRSMRQAARTGTLAPTVASSATTMLGGAPPGLVCRRRAPPGEDLTLCASTGVARLTFPAPYLGSAPVGARHRRRHREASPDSGERVCAPARALPRVRHTGTPAARRPSRARRNRAADVALPRGWRMGMSDAVIVTGSDSGIGRATAVALADAGHDIGVTWHRDEAGAEETAGGFVPPASARRSPH